MNTPKMRGFKQLFSFLELNGNNKFYMDKSRNSSFNW